MYVLIFEAICILIWLFFILIWHRAGEFYEIKRKGPSILPVPLFIMAVFAVSFIFPFAWAFFPISLAGLIIFAAGFIAALIAKGTLGDNWSTGNQIRTGHELITEIPFSIVRHPIYSAMITMFIGSSLIFGSLTMLAATIVLALILALRAYFEEKMLIEEFGQEYILYQEKVPFMLPRIFSLIGSLTGRSREEQDEEEY